MLKVKKEKELTSRKLRERRNKCVECEEREGTDV